jgi:hypothetical protein
VSSERPPCPISSRQAINGDDDDHAAKLIQDALGIESNDVVKPIASGAPAQWIKTKPQYLSL